MCLASNKLLLCLQDPTGLSHRAKGWSLLHLAASTAQPSSVAVLLKHGAYVQGAYYLGLELICGSLLLKRKGHNFSKPTGLHPYKTQIALDCLGNLACSVKWVSCIACYNIQAHKSFWSRFTAYGMNPVAASHPTVHNKEVRALPLCALIVAKSV